jgi:hypothetical protein
MTLMKSTKGWVCLAVALAFAGMAVSAGAQNTMLVVPTRADDTFTPAAAFLLGVEVILGDAAAVDVTAVTVAFGSTLLDLETESEVGEWEAEPDFASFAAMKSEITGTWTITIVGGTLASTTTFTFTTTSLDDGDFFATPTDLSPADGATGVAVDAGLSWSDPTGLSTPDALVVRVEGPTTDQEANSLADPMDPEFIAVDATMWGPSDDLESGMLEFSVFYADADDSFVSTMNVTAGTIAWVPPDFFQSYPTNKPFLALSSETIVAFTVPEPSSTTLALAALGTLALLARARRKRELRA